MLEIIASIVIIGIPFFFILIILVSLVTNKSFTTSRQGDGINLITGKGTILLTIIKAVILIYILAKEDFLNKISQFSPSILFLNMLVALCSIIVVNFILSKAYAKSKNKTKIDKIHSLSFLAFGSLDVLVYFVALLFLNFFLSKL